MARQLKVKEIAERAGVSAGTVDRVLHNRGKVSEEKSIAVERVLGEIKYKTNIHSSAIALRKGYRLVVCTPTALKGEYWGAVKRGIEQAVDEYSDIDIHCTWISYDQFDIQS